MNAVEPLQPGHGVQPYAFHRPPRTEMFLVPASSRDRSVPLYVPREETTFPGWAVIAAIGAIVLVGTVAFWGANAIGMVL